MMNRATLLVLLALVLAAGGAGVIANSASASELGHLNEYQAASRLYFPFVPNDTMIGDTGPWHSSITIQSLQAGPVVVWVLPDGRFDPDQALASFTMHSSYETRTLTAAELGVDQDGSSLVVAAIDLEVWRDRESESGLEARAALGALTKPQITASLKQSAPGPMEEGTRTDSSHTVVDGYSAIPMNDVGWGDLALDCPTTSLNNCPDIEGFEPIDGYSYLPLVQSNSGWNTMIYVSNIEGALDADSAVEIELIPTDNSVNDTDWSGAKWLRPGETWEVNVEELVGADWTGSVRMYSRSGMSAVAARYKASTNMMLMNTSVPSRSDHDERYRLFAPLIYVDAFGWNTGISISNQSDNVNAVAVAFYDEEGDETFSLVQVVLPRGQSNLYLPGEVESGEGFIGSAVLKSEFGEPFHAAVDQVNYDNGSAMSHTLGSVGIVHPDVAPGNNHLGLPLLQKSNSLTPQGDTSGIQLFNPDPDKGVTAEIRVLTPSSSGSIEIQIPPLGSRNFYAPDEPQIPDGTVTSAIVTVTSGEGQVVALSNLVNYDIQGDGALVYPMLNGFGQSR